MRWLESLATESTSLQAYLREIAHFPRLSGDQEHDLALRVQQLDDEDALKHLVGSNLRFVVNYAKRYRHLGVAFLDLIHGGNHGLVEAAKRFEPGTHGAFVAHAAWWVREGIMHVVAESARIRSAPAGLSDDVEQNGFAVTALQAAWDHPAGPADMADQLDLTDEEVRLLSRLQRIGGSPVEQAFRLPAEESGDEDGTTGVDDEVSRTALLDRMDGSLHELEPRERQVIRLRYGLQGENRRSLEQIAGRLQVSRARVRQIASRAVYKLRRQRALQSGLN